ncbi:hypothetical protein HN51_007109 [Arachis hypogaea]
MITLANFEEVLSMLSSVAMERSFFLEEFPIFLSDAETEIKRRQFQRVEDEGDEEGFEEL